MLIKVLIVKNIVIWLVGTGLFMLSVQLYIFKEFS